MIHRHSRESGNPKAIGSKCVFASYRIPGSRFRGDDGNRRLETDILKLTTLPTEWDDELAKRDALLLLGYFRNFEEAFEGNVPVLQRDYFTLMSWLYFSPFICDMRSLALLQDSDVIRFPSFAIVFGKSNCGKTSLVDTLMTSMFGFAHTVDKGSFTKAQLRGLHHGYKRFPVVFDDIGRRAFIRPTAGTHKGRTTA